MAEYIESLEKLAEKFGQLEGVGRKTAMRMALSTIEMSLEDAEDFANVILEAKHKIHFCPICQNLTDKEICNICADETRDRTVILVVCDVKAVNALEKVREYRGVYHVLHGVISPMNGISPDQLKIRELLERIKNDGVREVIVATNPTIEGDTTAMYISRLLTPLGVKVTRLGYGVPVGADLEFADEVTLFRALESRREV